MWKLDNRGVIVLVSLLSGCVIFYTISGALIGILISLILVIYTCIVLLSDDSLVTRHALILFNCTKEVGVNLCKLIEKISLETSGYVFELFEAFKLFWRHHIAERMDRHRKNTYQLSSESFVDSSRDSSDSNALQGLSPIPKKIISARMSESENNIYRRRHSAAYESARAFDKVTSTPIASWKHREIGNGDVNKDAKINRNSMKKSSFEHSNSSNASRDHETAYSGNEDSPWGTTISPKMRQRAGGVKTVQTIAGPLLASTRYNIDAKTYTDVTSPGLSSRLTKYATEANSKLMHQSQYGTGQFPRVNLNSSPTPLINSRTGKLRLPVTVRVAPPDTMYHSPPERQKILSDICQAEASKSTPSVAQVLREISLKRHASRDDMTAELIKKQRTDGIFSDELENLEEMTQKRARDESSRSDEEISIDNTTSRPVKRTKKPSCYDIINSLSSSTNVSSGVKRKADISRSGTPEVGKHFKSFDSTQKISESKIHTDLKIDKIVDSRNSSITEINNSPRQVISTVSPTGILKPVVEESIPQKIKQIEEIFEDKKITKVNVPVKLTDRLFMREEPQNIDKLKTLIDEHSSVTRKFSGSTGDEIKKSDILNMRQTSMKAKLKSMFDAISGKTPSKIDPNVVIQAETVIPIASASSPSCLTTLSSTTSTTNINTSPISTSAIVPIIGKSKAQVTPKKHVTWNLPDSSSTSSSVSGTGVQQQTGSLEKKVEDTQKSVATLPTFNSPTSATSNFSSAFNVTNTPADSISNLGTTGSFPSTSTTTTTTSLFSVLQTSTPSNSTPTASNVPKSDVSTVVTSIPSVTAPRDPQAPSFSFGRSPASTATTPTSQTTMPMFSQQTQKLGFQPPSTASSTPASTIPRLFGTSPQSGTLFATATTASSTLPMTSATPSSTSNSMFLLKGAGMSTIAPKATGFNFGTTSAVSTTHGTVLTTSTTSNTTPSGTGFAFGTNATSTAFVANPTTTSTSTTQSGFTFGTDATKTVPTTLPSSGFSFGGNATVTPTTTQSSSFSFGPSTTAKPVFSFGAAPLSQAPASTTVLTFGTPTSSTPAFGTPPTSTRTLSCGAPPTCAPPPAFGTPSTTTPASAFGTPSTNTSTPTFGTPSTTAPPAFGTPSTTAPAPAFGTPSTPAPIPAFGTPSTTPAPAFVTQSTTSFGSTPTASIFGTPTTQAPPPYKPNPSTPLSFGPAKTTAPPAFGTTTTTTSSLFNGASTSVVTTSSSIFSGGGGIFGQGKPPPAFGATTTANSSGFGAGTNFGATLFGAQPTTTTGFGTNPTSTASFGTANTPASGFGAQTSTPAFGNPTTTTTTFGTNSTASSFGSAAPQAFGTYNAGTNSLFNPSNSTFGATTTAPPAFPTATSSTSVFGATPSNNFASPSTAPPAFGSTNSSFTGFGTSGSAAPPFGSSAPSFGTPSTSAPAFGGASGIGGGGFAFGGTPSTSTPAPPQQNSVFSFGAGGTGAGFQFNGTTPQTGGFNFSSATPGTSGTPNFSSPSPAFGASSSSTGGGMFSIGSGSTAPRSRSARQGRKQR